MSLPDAPDPHFLPHWCLHRNLTGIPPITQSAGIGGGPVINLCLMLGLGYSSRVATALTYIFLMGGSCSAYLQNMKKKRPDGTLLIDYQLVVLTLPMIMTGSLFGVS